MLRVVLGGVLRDVNANFTPETGSGRWHVTASTDFGSVMGSGKKLEDALLDLSDDYKKLLDKPGEESP